MIRFVADENLNNNIIRGILRRNPQIDIIRAQDAGLSKMDDPAVLAWAAHHNRVVLTHDVTTMTRYAYQRVQAGQPMPGLFEVGCRVPVSVAIEEVLLLAEFSLEGEWEGQVRYLPLQ